MLTYRMFSRVFLKGAVFVKHAQQWQNTRAKTRDFPGSWLTPDGETSLTNIARVYQALLR